MSTTAGDPTANRTDRTVLIVEDSELSREMLESILADSYRTISAATGAEALHAVEAHGTSISVILLDLMLPDMHGLDVLQTLRDDVTTRSIPVIVLTSDRASEVRCLDAGAVDFIPKPYPPATTILARIRRTIEISENNMLDDIQNISSSGVAEALSSDYFAIYYVNAKNDRFIEYSASEEYRRLGIETSGEDFFGLSRKNIERVIHPDDQEMFLDTFTKERVLATLYTWPTFTMTYRLVFDGEPTYVHMKISRMRDRDDNHIVVGISNIDEQVKAQEAFERAHQDSVTFSRIAQALAGDFFGIYYVDVSDGSFVEYSSTPEYEELDIEKEGDDFFGISRKNAEGVIYPEDLGRFLAVFTEERLLYEMEQNGIFTIKYRLLFGGEPTWVSMKATLMEDDHGSHIVIGINSIDAQMRREQEYNYNLSVARDKALRDPLTGVKSKHAFLEKEEEVDRAIAAGTMRNFAVVVLDVNGLKAINDTLGHNAGDQLIKDAAMIVCKTFKHSPVYRTGGDEFVVIAESQDYDHLDDLVGDFRRRSEDSRGKEGEVVIACGSSSFAGDASFSAVFDRADAAMYENKLALKA